MKNISFTTQTYHPKYILLYKYVYIKSISQLPHWEKIFGKAFIVNSYFDIIYNLSLSCQSFQVINTLYTVLGKPLV